MQEIIISISLFVLSMVALRVSAAFAFEGSKKYLRREIVAIALMIVVVICVLLTVYAIASVFDFASESADEMVLCHMLSGIAGVM